ncbi:MAG TPA: carboxyl transferase domain-containing protein [Bryobacteraceae bacterium]|nr:carboxyl transferase domain-containing protein [Bryobacteraceae bacterium]
MQSEFQRVAIVNRGEPAMRFLHAVHEFNQEHGASLHTIALFTDPDRDAMFVREADEAFSLGPAHFTDPRTGHAKSSYVDYDGLERALRSVAAEAVWVGWGFVAEHAEFADLCRDLGIVFIGPDGAVMRRLGDKITSKQLAEAAHIPVAPWSGGAVETLADARLHAERLGYPLLIKATAGGGGHGIRRVHFSSELPNAFERARAEAFKAFGNPTVFLEQLLERARHVEVQIIADHYGTTWAAGVRDCTIQRRHQKILEEAPSPALSPEQDEALREAAVRLSMASAYRNAGTVEFLYQPEHQLFSFMEMNTRLQVEHPVTECTTGIDLVKLQIHIARGGRLEGAPPHTRGHAIEVRLNAEDADNGFAPAPGVIKRLRIPTGPGVRVDTGVAEGDVVPPDFDSMIAKIIAYGQTRMEALSRLQRALRDSVVVIQGGASNRAFLLELLGNDDVRRAAVHVNWLDRLAAAGEHVSRRNADVALLQAAVEAYEAEAAIEKGQFYASAAHGRPHVKGGTGRTVELRYRGNAYTLKVCQLGPKQYGVEADGSRIQVRLDRLGPFEYRLTGWGRRFHVVSVAQGLTYRIDVDGVSHLIERDDGGIVRAPAPAIVVSFAVEPGDIVSAGQPLAVLEAMKMEMQVVAPFAGRVRSVTSKPYVQVDAGAPLLQIEPAAADATVAATERVAFRESRAADAQEAGASSRGRILNELRQLMLGFDLEPGYTARLLADWQIADEQPDDLATRRGEDEILEIFADICSLFERQPAANGLIGSTAPSAESYLFSYLRAIETRGEGLPPSFVESLRRALAHYGVRSLERSPELEESLVWIFKSHQRLEREVAPVVRVLERRLGSAEAESAAIDDSFRLLLDRIISVTHALFPAVSDLAREVRYRLFDRPLFERARQQVYDEAAEHLACLEGHPEGPGRDRRIRALLDCPQLLARLFLARFAAASPYLQQLMLEVLTRRYYKIPSLRELRTIAGCRCSLSGEYEQDGKRVRLLTTYAPYGSITQAAQALFPSIGQAPPEHEIAIDFYVSSDDAATDAETMQREFCAAINQAAFPHSINRIVVVVAGGGAIEHFSYTPHGQAYEEEKLYRGIHPIMAERLHLWRLANFELERLPSVEDVYVLHAVARENPKDERLFACAEVRDLTPVRDQEGRITELPHLERMFTEAAAGIRLAQSHRSTRERLHWNRILLYVWPSLTLKPEEIRHIALKLVPLTEGLGLEQVVVHARTPDPKTGELREMVIRLSGPSRAGLQITIRPATRLQPLRPLTPYTQKVVRMRQRGLIYPYEIVKMLTPPMQDTRAELPPGNFVEHDLSSDGLLVPMDRPYGQNSANIIAGVITNFTTKYPEGMERVLLLGDPSKDLGAIAEPECRRILAALDLAEYKGVPLEWFPISAGAKISMESGVENMDWIARVLRRLVEFTQAGGEVNLVIDGINVGAQPYWNAEATMLMHTRGILIMTQKAAMVLTGKRALDYSGSVSAEDNLGIGGYDRIMGANGQAQYWARDIEDACHILLRHYEHTYVAPGERFPRRSVTADPADRDVRGFPHGEACEGFASVGEIFSDETNPGRKKSFDIRRVMLSVIDQDHAPLERWGSMRAAETAVVWDAHLGGYPVCFIGIESRPVARIGFVPADGPDQWSAGTLFPLSSKKVARAINAATNNRPVVLLANLSGFDGSPESMRKLQLEYGAEIGRAVVNFKGPIVFCVISRYHGGAYVVFSRALSEFLEVLALEGTYASVIGGAPAAAVVFASEVEARARKDPRLEALSRAMTQAEGMEKTRLRAQWNELFPIVHSEKLGEMADEFDRVHSVHRALRVGALDNIIPPAKLRPYLIGAVERGLQKVEAAVSTEDLVATASV